MIPFFFLLFFGLKISYPKETGSQSVDFYIRRLSITSTEKQVTMMTRNCRRAGRGYSREEWINHHKKIVQKAKEREEQERGGTDDSEMKGIRREPEYKTQGKVDRETGKTDGFHEEEKEYTDDDQDDIMEYTMTEETEKKEEKEIDTEDQGRIN